MSFIIYVCSEEIRRQLPDILQNHGIKVEAVDLPDEFVESKGFSFICSRGAGRICLNGHFDTDIGQYQFYMAATHAVFWCSDMRLMGKVGDILLRNGVAHKIFEGEGKRE